MTETITVLYDNKAIATGAVNELIDSGFAREQISLVSQAEGDEANAPTNNLHASAATETKNIVHDAGIGAMVAAQAA